MAPSGLVTQDPALPQEVVGVVAALILVPAGQVGLQAVPTGRAAPVSLQAQPPSVTAGRLLLAQVMGTAEG
jgi:hypothetical protein